MAQLVEHVIGNDEVISSNLIASSNKKRTFVYQDKGAFFELSVPRAERDAHFVRDVSFGSDVRFARE